MIMRTKRNRPSADVAELKLVGPGLSRPKGLRIKQVEHRPSSIGQSKDADAQKRRTGR
jgi:hypothetical protein